MYQMFSFLGKFEIHGNNKNDVLPEFDFYNRPLPMGTKAYIVDGGTLTKKSWDAENKVWVVESTGGGGGGGGESAKLENSISVTLDVGGIKKNKFYPAGTTMEAMWNDLVSPALTPTLTEPSVNLNYLSTNLFKVGATIPASVANIVFNRGTINPAYGTSGYRSGEATSYHFDTNGADVDYTPADKNTGTFDVPSLTRSTKGNIRVSASVRYAQGEQPKNSEGGNYDSPYPAGTKSASKVLEFILPFYHGQDVSDSATDLGSFTEDLSRKTDKKYTYTANNQYLYIAYDASYGELKSIIDENNAEAISGWIKSDVVYNGQSYILYRNQYALTGTFQFTFKF